MEAPNKARVGQPLDQVYPQLLQPQLLLSALGGFDSGCQQQGPTPVGSWPAWAPGLLGEAFGPWREVRVLSLACPVLWVPGDKRGWLGPQSC